MKVVQQCHYCQMHIKIATKYIKSSIRSQQKIEIWQKLAFQRLNLEVYTVVIISSLYFVLLCYSLKSWTIFKTRVSFGICWFWQFQNTPYMSNLTKFWPRYLRLKIHDTTFQFLWQWIWLRGKLLISEHFVWKAIDKTF